MKYLCESVLYVVKMIIFAATIKNLLYQINL